MFVRARAIRFPELRAAWGLVAFLALGLVLIATAPSQACGHTAKDAGIASQQIVADIEAFAPAMPGSLSAVSDHGCCTGASHANGCANGSCAPCAAALADVAAMVDPPVMAAPVPAAPDTPMRAAPSGNFRPPRSAV